MFKLITLVSSLLFASSFAYAIPFAKGDPKVGKALHDKTCVACHDSNVYARRSQG